jgi:hypothetical protein
MIQSRKKIVNQGKEHVKHARIMETKGAAILAFRHWDSPKIKKTNKQTFVNTKKWQPFQGPLSSFKRIVDHMLPIIAIVMVSNYPLLDAFFI